MAEQTPLMKQYWEVKDKYPDSILFFRLGDFYEMFFEDAQIAAEELEIALTSRGQDKNGPIPMAGVPYHSYKGYAAKLLKKGYKIAICEQVEDPRKAKGIVKRAVKRILTPGTVLEEGFLEGGQSNYLLCLRSGGLGWAIAYCDVSTGEAHGLVMHGTKAFERILEEIVKLSPSEIIASEKLRGNCTFRRALKELNLAKGAVTLDDEALKQHARGARPFCPNGQVDRRIASDPLLEKALASLAGYVSRNQESPFEHFSGVKVHDAEANMGLDPATVRNLELLQTMMHKDRRGSLIDVLDETVTAMGSRLLRYWLLHPLCDKLEIENRLSKLDVLVGDLKLRNGIKENLRYIYDIPRIVGRVSTSRANARDLNALSSTIARLPEIRELCCEGDLADMTKGFDSFSKLRAKLENAIVEDPPSTIIDGNIIREGYDEELDELRAMSGNAKDWLEEFERKEQEKTGVRSLKVKSNKVFCY